MPVFRHPIAADASEPSPNLRKIPLDQGLIDRLRHTFDAAKRDDELALARIFYNKLFTAHPTLRQIFPDNLERQAEKLTAMLDEVLANLEAPESNQQRLRLLGNRHWDYGVKLEHYDIVVNLLVDSLRQLLNTTVPDARIEEWRVMLNLIAQQMSAKSL